MEPAFFLFRMAGVVDAERVLFATKYEPNGFGDLGGFRRVIADGIVTGFEVVDAEKVVGTAVFPGEAAPGTIGKYYAAMGVEDGQIGMLYGIQGRVGRENGGCCGA